MLTGDCIARLYFRSSCGQQNERVGNKLQNNSKVCGLPNVFGFEDISFT